ncbi:MAG: PilZ domain-containing protein [Candidatus Acidiferrales bacterium]
MTKKPYEKPEIASRELHPMEIKAGSRFAERRSTPRYALIATAEIVEPVGNIRLSGRTSEIGLGGCYVDVLNTLPKGTVIELSIQRDIGVLKTWGRVVYAQENMGMGVQFFDISPEQQTLLKSWLADLSASE